MSRRGRAILSSRRAASEMLQQIKLSRSSHARWGTIHACLARLWEGTDVTAEIEHIYRLEPGLLHAVLHQCVHYILHAHHTSAARSLERFLLQACADSTQLAFEFYWLLVAQPPPPLPSIPSSSPRAKRRSLSLTLLPVLENSEKSVGSLARSGSVDNTVLLDSPFGKAARIERLLERLRTVVEQPKQKPASPEGQAAAAAGPSHASPLSSGSDELHNS
ncbi:MAG: hypothetical protein SGPRY_003399 [Prymnesium sp.]